MVQRYETLSRRTIRLSPNTLLVCNRLLSGTQGFSTTSPEYGFWYRYFDVYNKRIGLSNMRFVSDSNGNNNGRYKAMPWARGFCPLPFPSAGDRWFRAYGTKLAKVQ